MQKTSNYHLNQYELTDRIQMENFNADNAKIDAALAEVANVAVTSGAKIITGSYVGDGTTSTKHHSIGAKPKVLILANRSFANSTCTMQVLCAGNFRIETSSGGSVISCKMNGFATFTDDGFSLNHTAFDVQTGFNRTNVTTDYLAIC